MIGILYIATGKYKIFFEKFYHSAIKNFIIDKDKRFFVFTDDPEYFQNYNDVEVTKIDHNSFPLDSLLRFRFFNKNKSKFNNCDYLIFMNSNMIINKKISFDDFFVDNHNNCFWGVNHPGWYNQEITNFPYERNKKSNACIKPGDGKIYYQGCLFAGKTYEFLFMCDYLDQMIMGDLNNNYIAIWHDESHINKFFLENTPVTLNPSFAYPEYWHIPFEKNIIQLEKKIWFNKL